MDGYADVSGYSGTPTARKLGIKPGQTVTVLGAPVAYARLVDGLPAGVNLRTSLRGKADLVHVFVTREGELTKRMGGMRNAVEPDGVIWVSWPKRASRVPTDLTEDVIRRVALAHQLVDVKVCAVDDTWSGLKLVIRREHRRP
jgi:hypothetical protein